MKMNVPNSRIMIRYGRSSMIHDGESGSLFVTVNVYSVGDTS